MQYEYNTYYFHVIIKIGPAIINCRQDIGT